MERIITEILRVDSKHPDPVLMERAAEILRRGGLVAFPTETVYGLGANALDPQAVSRIFAAKGRPANNPLIVHVTDVEAAREVVAEWPVAATRLTERFWPGPLTLVLARHLRLPDVVTAGGPTVGVRVPAHPVAMALLRATGLPIAAPSANRSLQVSPTRAAHVIQGLEGRIEAIMDGGATTGGLESTVLSLAGGIPRLLRPGLITPAQIEAVIGPIERGALPVEADKPLPSPGLLRRHYAPRARLELVPPGDFERRLHEVAQIGVRVGILTFETTFSSPALPGVTLIPMSMDPLVYAADLYTNLHELDRQGVEVILVASPPDSEAWLAVRDRLERAAMPA